MKPHLVRGPAQWACLGHQQTRPLADPSSGPLHLIGHALLLSLLASIDGTACDQIYRARARAMEVSRSCHYERLHTASTFYNETKHPSYHDTRVQILRLRAIFTHHLLLLVPSRAGTLFRGHPFNDTLGYLCPRDGLAIRSSSPGLATPFTRRPHECFSERLQAPPAANCRCSPARGAAPTAHQQHLIKRLQLQHGFSTNTLLL
jgi:hypothetical protein